MSFERFFGIYLHYDNFLIFFIFFSPSYLVKTNNFSSIKFLAIGINNEDTEFDPPPSPGPGRALRSRCRVGEYHNIINIFIFRLG